MQHARLYRRLRLARRVSQGAFLLLFFFFLLKTSIDRLGAPQDLPRISAPVGFFLEIDPLIALFSLVSGHGLYRNLLWALALAAGTLFLGRFFCGWMCPMGTINQLLSSIRHGRTRGKKRLDANRYRPYQRWKYGILAALLGAAVFTSLQVGLFDPIALLTRSLALTVLPAYNVAMHAAAGWAGSDESLLQPVAPAISAVAQWLLLRAKPVVFEGGLLLAALFFALLAANRFITRFWCRGLCPLGALLGVFARFSIFGMEKHPSLCTDCNKCALNCQGGDDPQPGYTWRQSECHLCLNCVADCPEAGISFRFFPGREHTRPTPDIARRTVLASMAGGLAAVPLFRAEPAVGKRTEPALVRPPGSVTETDFLARCVRCGECMNVCPNNALHPTFMQAGLEGVWSPMLVPRIGYCEPTCVLCGQVCPTGAIDEITEREKGWVPVKGGQPSKDQPIRIGTAFYDLGRCLPWAMATECIVCEEWCPTSPKAIYFEEVEVRNRKGDYVLLKRPHVDPQLCIGCGACTYACPIKGDPAIEVTNVGETRNPANSILLKVRREGN
jgi:polyferredoxin